MHTTIGFSGTGAAGAGWANLAAVVDPHKKTEGDYIYMDDWNKIIGAAGAYGAGCTMSRLMAPSIRRVNPYHLTEFEVVAQPTYIIRNIFDLKVALALVIGEGLENEIFVDAATILTTIVFLASVVPDPVKGNIHTVRFNTSPVRTASAWSFAEILLEDPLPVGTYDIVGARLECATGIAFRLVPIGGVHRPGGMTVASYLNDDVPLQRKGGLGVWCTFEHGILPGLELISSAAAAALKIYGFLDIIPK